MAVPADPTLKQILTYVKDTFTLVKGQDVQLDDVEELIFQLQEVINQMATNQQDLDTALSAVQQSVGGLADKVTGLAGDVTTLANAVTALVAKIGTPPDFTTEVTALTGVKSSADNVGAQVDTADTAVKAAIAAANAVLGA